MIYICNFAVKFPVSSSKASDYVRGSAISSIHIHYGQVLLGESMVAVVAVLERLLFFLLRKLYYFVRPLELALLYPPLPVHLHLIVQLLQIVLDCPPLHLPLLHCLLFPCPFELNIVSLLLLNVILILFLFQLPFCLYLPL